MFRDASSPGKWKEGGVSFGAPTIVVPMDQVWRAVLQWISSRPAIELLSHHPLASPLRKRPTRRQSGNRNASENRLQAIPHSNDNMHRVIDPVADFFEFCQRFFQFRRQQEKMRRSSVCLWTDDVEFLGSLSIFDVFKSLSHQYQFRIGVSE